MDFQQLDQDDGLSSAQPSSLSSSNGLSVNA